MHIQHQQERKQFTVRDIMKARGGITKQSAHQLIKRRGIKLTDKIGNVWILTLAQFKSLTGDPFRKDASN